MTVELFQYIQSEIMPTAGVVEEDLTITELPLFIEWMRKTLFVDMQPTVENLQGYLLAPDEDILHKQRRLYLNSIDYHLLDLANTEDVAVLPHKQILEVLIFADDVAKPGTFAYLSDDEFMIMKNV